MHLYVNVCKPSVPKGVSNGETDVQRPGDKSDAFSSHMMRRICSANFTFPQDPPVSNDVKELLRKVGILWTLSMTSPCLCEPRCPDSMFL